MMAVSRPDAAVGEAAPMGNASPDRKYSSDRRAEGRRGVLPKQNTVKSPSGGDQSIGLAGISEQRVAFLHV
jgi:hypothetical protein